MEFTSEVIDRRFGDCVCPVQGGHAGPQSDASGDGSYYDEFRRRGARFEKRVRRLEENLGSYHIDLHRYSDMESIPE